MNYAAKFDRLMLSMLAGSPFVLSLSMTRQSELKPSPGAVDGTVFYSWI